MELKLSRCPIRRGFESIGWIRAACFWPRLVFAQLGSALGAGCWLYSRPRRPAGQQASQRRQLICNCGRQAGRLDTSARAWAAGQCCATATNERGNNNNGPKEPAGQRPTARFHKAAAFISRRASLPSPGARRRLWRQNWQQLAQPASLETRVRENRQLKLALELPRGRLRN